MKYGPLQRAAITAASILTITALYAGWRMLDSHGVFTSVTPGFAGTCRTVKSPVGPEDIVFDGNLAIVSAMDRLAHAKGEAAPSDGLYLYDPAKPEAGLVKLAGTPGDFHPHGISLYRAPDGTRILMAINHRAGGTSSIDIFQLDGTPPALKEIGEIESGLLISPNAIAAVDEQRFYLVNDHTSKSAFGRWLDDTFALPRSDVVYFDGDKFLEVAKQLNFPNGAVLSADGSHLYVTESYTRQLDTFERNPFSGQLKSVSALPIPSNLDNLRLGPSGELWIGSHPKAYAMASYRADPTTLAPSVIYRVTVVNGIPQGAEPVYSNLGEEISGASVGAVANGHLLIGSPYGEKILDCALP